MTPDAAAARDPGLSGAASQRRSGVKARSLAAAGRMLVFDTETRTDAAQALTFGSYRYFEDSICLEEGLFYGDDFPSDRPRGAGSLHRVTRSRVRSAPGVPELRPLTRRELSRKAVYRRLHARGLIVGFNCRLTCHGLPRFGTSRDAALPAAFPSCCGTT